MKLVIVEKISIKTYLNEITNKSNELKEILGDYKVYSLYHKIEPIKITEKENGKPFFLSHIFHEDSARNTSDKYFPFDPLKFNFEIIDPTKINELNNLIEQADTIIYMADSDRMGNSKFNSLIYSGLFNLDNKKIFSAVNDENFSETSIMNSFKNLKDQILFSNELKLKTSVRVLSIESEIALNEIHWKKPNLNLEDKATISNEVVKKYSNKYGVDLNKAGTTHGYYFRYDKNESFLNLKKLKNELIDLCFDKELLKEKGILPH